jgi:transposase-like protein
MGLPQFQVHEAFQRAAAGESVRSLAREFGVDESTLREHFRKGGATPRQVRDLAFKWFYAQQAKALLDADERRL